MKRLFKAVAVFTVLLLSMAAHVSAAVPYQSYTYTYYAQPIHSPDAYAPEKEYPGTYFDELGFKDPADLFVTDDGEIFVADAGNNRVVVLNSDMTFKAQIVDYPNPEDETDPITMKNPGGIFVTGDGDIYIADTGNGRILILDKEYKLKEILGAPESDIFPDGFVFTPNSLAVDKSGRIYVVVNNSNMGILALKSDGSFESFVGAQKVNPSMSDLIWRVFMTEEQIERTKKFVPTEYNNIAIDSRDFVYVTTSAIEQWNQYAAAISRSKDSQYAPVKMFNPSGVDVLKRTGFFPPAGDIQVEFGSDDSYGPSQITDVAVGPYGTYSLVDSRRNKIFTYDADGNLLIAFSGKGMQTGLFQSISSIAYQGDKILALDKVRNSITVFATTDYGKLLYSAIDLHDRRKFQDEAKVWESILMANSNNEMAYTGMGNAMMQQKEYHQAMDYFKRGNNVTDYSRAYEEARKQDAKKFFLLVPVLVIALFILITKLSKWMKKYNKSHIAYAEKRSLKDQLIYAWHYIFHPFDGAWDLNRQNRGGYAGAAVILGLSVLSFILKDLLGGFILTNGQKQVDLFGSAFNVLVPFVIFCVANWCLTSLMNGEGSMKSIIVTSAYSLTPLVLLTVPATIIGNFLLVEEMAVFQLITSISYLWMGILLFAGTLTIHGYSLPKNILTIILTLVGMAFIIFLVLLTVTLGSRMLAFFSSLWQEFTFRG